MASISRIPVHKGFLNEKEKKYLHRVYMQNLRYAIHINIKPDAKMEDREEKKNSPKKERKIE